MVVKQVIVCIFVKNLIFKTKIMFATNTKTLTENQIEFAYNAIEAKLTKLGFEESETHHFSFMGTRGFCDESTEFVYQVLFEFGNGENFFHVSCDMNDRKSVKVKTLKLEDQN